MSDYKHILHDQANHKLVECFRELRWGRPADEQIFLTKLAELVERNGVQREGLNKTLEELDDPADWWKHTEDDDE